MAFDLGRGMLRNKGGRLETRESTSKRAGAAEPTGEKTSVANGGAGTTGAALCCGVAMALIVLGDWTLNMGLHPAMAQIAPTAREASSAAKMLAFVLVVFICYAKPSKLHSRALSIAAGALAVAAAALLMAGLQLTAPGLLMVGAPLLALARAWACVVVGAALVSLSATSCMRSVFTAFIAVAIARSLLGGFSGELAAGMLALMCVGSLVAAMGLAAPQFKATREGDYEPSVLAVVQPSSVLPFFHKIFVAILLFSLAFGYSLTFRSTNGMPATSAVAGLLLLLVLAVVLMGKSRYNFDSLYRVAVLMILLGLLVSLIPHAPDTFTNVLLSSGSECFQALVWCLLAAIGRQNVYVAIPMIAWGQCALQGGVLCGTTLGHFVNDAYVRSPDLLPAITSAIVFAFVAYQILALHGFSFDAAIRGIQQPKNVVATDRAVEFEQVCAAVGQKHELTQREGEIFLLMAKGRNNRFIQEELCLSHNTVKTHIMHIYAKLGVHSHQELIDLVEHW